MDKIANFVGAEKAYQLPDKESNEKKQIAIAPEPANGISPSHVSRIFMSHFGYLGIQEIGI